MHYFKRRDMLAALHLISSAGLSALDYAGRLDQLLAALSELPEYDDAIDSLSANIEEAIDFFDNAHEFMVLAAARAGRLIKHIDDQPEEDEDGT